MDNIIHVIKTADRPSKGLLHFQGQTFDCALGQGGVLPQFEKHEGDGATPAGLYSLKRLFVRGDKQSTPPTHLPVTQVQQNMGWCDDIASANYNQLVSLPFRGSHEALWRDDDLYDLIIETSHNSAPVRKGAGSCIFMHVAREGLTPTRGCVALTKTHLIHILENMGENTLLRIHP